MNFKFIDKINYKKEIKKQNQRKIIEEGEKNKNKRIMSIIGENMCFFLLSRLLTCQGSLFSESWFFIFIMNIKKIFYFQ